MAVAVNGTLFDLGGAAVPTGLNPVLDFVPSKGGRIGSKLLTKEPIRASLTGSAWTAQLEPTDPIRDLYYTPRVRHFRADGSHTATHYLPVELYVPAGGGPIGSFPGLPMSPNNVRVQLEHPRIADPAFTGWWLHSVPGDPDPGTDTGTGRLVLIL